MTLKVGKNSHVTRCAVALAGLPDSVFSRKPLLPTIASPSNDSCVRRQSR